MQLQIYPISEFRVFKIGKNDIFGPFQFTKIWFHVKSGGSKSEKCPFHAALTSHFESFWSIVYTFNLGHFSPFFSYLIPSEQSLLIKRHPAAFASDSVLGWSQKPSYTRAVQVLLKLYQVWSALTIYAKMQKSPSFKIIVIFLKSQNDY